LAREFGKRFGDAAYAMEELGAETTSAFMSASGASQSNREDHVQYLAPWRDILKTDDRAIMTAASHAQKAADYCDGLQPARPKATVAEGGDELRL
jgi:antirestriction protein ArdC